MPKRTAKQIRIDTLEELRANGTLPNPLFGLSQADRNTVVTKKKAKEVRQPKQKICCLDKYGDNLPRGFRPCVDCFRTENST